MADPVRLDIWLDVACLFKTRSEAQRECKVGRVTVNGVVAKPNRELRVGDELVITRPAGRKQMLAVLGLADKHLSRADARQLYEDRTPAPTEDEREAARMTRLFRAMQPSARPTRRTQRDLARGKFTS